MAFPFEIIEHTIPAQHIREWPRATAVSQDEALQLHVKQYKPVDNPDPQPGDVTIIGAHANGFPKEVYEALWADLHAVSRNHGFRIRGIWIADAAHQGRSGVLNEQVLGNDPSWYDYARDMLHMTNVFRADMPRPIIGIGHSYGGNVLTHLSLLHARLFTTLVLFDPVINRFSPDQVGAINTARLSTIRRDTWPTREAAADSFRRSPFHSSWDPRVLDAWIVHGIRDTPASATGHQVALTSSRHQEIFTFFRPLYPYLRADGTVDREGAPDFDPALNEGPKRDYSFPFYRNEGTAVLERLPHVRPSVLFVYGAASEINPPPAMRSEIINTCGTGSDGSGGVKAGRVVEILLEGRGHLFPLEVPGLCADHAATWVGKEMERYRNAQREYEQWTHLPISEKATVSKQFLDAMGGPPSREKKATKRPGPNL